MDLWVYLTFACFVLFPLSLLTCAVLLLLRGLGKNIAWKWLAIAGTVALITGAWSGVALWLLSHLRM